MVVVQHEKFSFRKAFRIFVWVFVGLIVLNLVVSYFSQEDLFRPQVYIIPIAGEISIHNGGLFSNGGLAADEIINLIELADKDEDVVAIILEINTPGGTVVASEDIAKAVESAEKPVIAWMREVAASGGYWIAASADEIVADPATITGSIGVTGSYLSFDGLFDEYGITYERLVSGPYKDAGTPYRDLTPSERALIQGKIDAINELFIKHVSRTRDMPINDVRRVATGEIFLGSEAHTLGLIDTLGGKKEAIKAAETLAGVSNLRVITYEKSSGLLDRLSALTSIDINIEGKNSLALMS